jgi:SAM-dependent methyltransferase
MTAGDDAGREHWNAAAANWRHYTSPLRPCAEDQATFLRFIAAHDPTGARREALMLGVTPEIANLDWPQGVTVTAADRAPEMIKAFWPSDRPALRPALCVDWFELPTPSTPYDLVLADGSFNLVDYPGDLRRLLDRLAGAVAPGAMLITRTFTRPVEAESLSALEQAARAGRAGGFHAFKFRLAMAFQPSPEAGVSLGDIWRLWRRLDDEIDDLTTRNGWLPEQVRTIDLFRDKDVRLRFPTREELTGVFQAAGLALVDSDTPTYEMGDRCPIMAWRF